MWTSCASWGGANETRNVRGLEFETGGVDRTSSCAPLASPSRPPFSAPPPVVHVLARLE